MRAWWTYAQWLICSDAEVKRYHKLRLLSSNATLTNTEIAEMVLADDWASKQKLQHELKINDVTS